MKRSTVIITMSFILSALIFCGYTFAEGGVVIINKGNSKSSLSASDIKKIYKGKKSGWRVVEQKKKSSIREIFSESILKKDPSEMERYYLKRSMSGKGQPPKVIDSSDAVKSFVAGNKDAIGYVEVDKADDSVKVVHEFK